MTEVDPLELHAAVLFDIDGRGRLLRTNEPEPQQAPRLFVVRGHAAVRWWLRADVDPATEARCERVLREIPPWDGSEPDTALADGVRRAIGRRDVSGGEDASVGWDPSGGAPGGVAFRSVPGAARTPVRERVDAKVILVDGASAAVLDDHFPYTREVLDDRSPVAAVLVEGVAVAACYCARRRATAAEAGVATVEAFRGRGFATAAVARWRDVVETQGRIALHSTTWDNAASRRVAEVLGFVAYADTLSIG